MNIKYLQEVLIPQREKEIEEGKNACTRQPIYVVMDVVKEVILDHVEINPSPYNEIKPRIGYYDIAADPENRVFKKSNNGMENPYPCTIIYLDKVIASFLTRKGAEEYLEDQKHNLNKGYIYTFYSRYGNKEMDKLLEGK